MPSMPITDSTFDTSAFHPGERAVQQRLGVADKLDHVGRQVIRDFMPDQHREFFAQLPFLIAGCVDAQGQPWASVLVGQPGFVSSPDQHHLRIQAQPPAGDPLHATLATGAAIGLLGIEPHTRRRNRMNGIVQQIAAEGFTVEVTQSFGNCPKYIQARTPSFVPDKGASKRERRGDRLDDAMRRLAGSADTLFIATAFTGCDAVPAHQRGADVSHRGGKPGFVRVDDERTLTMPDFVGNYFFNTLGNLTVNPRAGLLFIDFSNGDLLYLAVDADIIWDGAEVQAFAGAQRLLRFHVRQAVLVEAALALRWSEAALSPVLEKTGSWEEAAACHSALDAPHGCG